MNTQTACIFNYSLFTSLTDKVPLLIVIYFYQPVYYLIYLPDKV
jgi:hypothetical protein